MIIKQIKTARKAAKLTQKQLADKIGSYPANISELESGKVPPTLTTIQKIANALKSTFIIKPQRNKP